MSDARRRELERRWRETGAHEDEVALLRERVRAGDLPAERLVHAALCGHEAARHACDLDAVISAPLSAPWVERLRDAPGELHVRLALALAREVLPDFARLLPADERPARALHAAEWLATAPDDATAQHAVTSAVPLVVDAIEDRSRRSDFLRPARAAACAALAATECVALHAGLGVVHWQESTYDALRSALSNAIELARTRDGLLPPEHLERLGQALARTVVPWLLRPPAAPEA